jgi:hypothetical protein
MRRLGIASFVLAAAFAACDEDILPVRVDAGGSSDAAPTTDGVAPGVDATTSDGGPLLSDGSATLDATLEDSTIVDATFDAADDAAVDAGASDAADASDGRVAFVDPPFTIPAGKVCTADAWCWEYPSPQGNWFHGVWGTSASNVYAVAGFGTIVHFDGANWSGVALGPADDVIDLGGGASTDRTYAFRSVGGSGPNDVWVGGGYGRILHFDGGQWTPKPAPPDFGITSIGSTAPDDAWAVGGRGQTGTIMHWNGSDWSPVTLPVDLTSTPLTAMRIVAADDIWVTGVKQLAFGENGLVLHFDGQNWSVPHGRQGQYNYLGLWADDASVVLVGQVSAFAITDTRTGVGDAATWTVDNVTSLAFFTDIAAITPNDMWATGYPAPGPLHWDGGSWTAVSGPTNTLSKIWLHDATEGWAVGASGAMRHFDGGSWSPQGSIATSLVGVWGSANDDVWLVGQQGGFLSGPPAVGVFLHFDGNTIAVDSTVADHAVNSVWGAAANDVWAVGNGGYIGHRVSSWNAFASPTSTGLNHVHGSASDDVWAVGSAGTILRYAGSSWQAITSGTDQPLWSVFAITKNDAWAIGEGVVLHWTGSSWDPVDTGSTQTYRTVWASGPNDVWLGGSTGVRHWNGNTWTTPSDFPFGYILAIRGTSDHDIWATGDNTMHFDGVHWSRSLAPLTQDGFTRGFELWTSGSQSWIVGGGGSAIRRIEPADGGN